MLRADVLSMTVLLAGTLATTVAGAAELPRQQGAAQRAGAAVTGVSVSQADSPVAAQDSDGYHLTPAELAKLREQVRTHWMQGRSGSGPDAASGLPLAEDGGRSIAR
ncbi:hypothetical protein QTH91_07360 [Variovorax dokdonensis]|uniref:DUF4148 domain-containing protein n=1 Tax=Variovorax dokdonensis TaxID=344883 RepID=A0ABT7N8M6_9BURK|nr:hypothetical protein [Variovorax dokdonensis]MDM0044293.1 hypothetical protein [Variovorax dokdonensis]